MTLQEIEAADLIFKYGTIGILPRDKIARDLAEIGVDYSNVARAAKFLESEGFLIGLPGSYKLTAKGLEFQRSEKKYSEYLEEKKSKEALESRHKELQIRELEEKLEVMNKEQLKFWGRQRWQFWLTFIVASAAFVLSVINFLKSMIVN